MGRGRLGDTRLCSEVHEFRGILFTRLREQSADLQFGWELGILGKAHPDGTVINQGPGELVNEHDSSSFRSSGKQLSATHLVAGPSFRFRNSDTQNKQHPARPEWMLPRAEADQKGLDGHS